jgi:uncharacterized protein YndB with AHSA1/START domain
MEKIKVERVIEAPPAAVFERYTDHAGWSRWAGIGKVLLAREGSTARNGVGAVRAFASAPGLKEEVVSFEPPTRMTYRVISGGFPIKEHFGEVEFEPHPRGTKVVWTCSFDSRVPFTAGAMARFIEKMFAKLLVRFEERGMAS